MFRPVHKLQEVQWKYDNTTDEEFYLRDLLLAVEQRNLETLKFIMPSIKEQERVVMHTSDVGGNYFPMSTENSFNYRWVLGEALRMASHHGSLDIVQFMIESGARLNDGDEEGLTSLMKACEQGHLDVVKKLLDCGADINKTNNVGSTALQRTSRLPKQWRVVAELLDRKDVDVNDCSHKTGKTALHCAAELDTEGKNIRLLLEHFAEQNAKDKEGKSALHWACERERYGCVRELIKFGAFVNLQDDILGSTPLHIASQRGYVDICELLIACGANFNIKDKYGLTSKQRMINHSKINPEKQAEYVKILLLFDRAQTIQNEKRLIMDEIMSEVNEMIPSEKWEVFYKDLFKTNPEADAVIEEMEGKLPFEALPLVAHHVLDAWLDHCRNVANFWVFDRSLRDNGMHMIADTLLQKYGDKFLQAVL